MLSLKKTKADKDTKTTAKEDNDTKEKTKSKEGRDRKSKSAIKEESFTSDESTNGILNQKLRSLNGMFDLKDTYTHAS